MTTTAALYEASSLIDRYGWTKGQIYDEPVRYTGRPPMCALGAILVATDTDVALYEECVLDTASWLLRNSSDSRVLFAPKQRLGTLQSAEIVIWTYNDLPRRSHGQVTCMLRRAAETGHDATFEQALLTAEAKLEVIQFQPMQPPAWVMKEMSSKYALVG